MKSQPVLKYLAALSAAMSILSCGGDMERPEEINKLRALGVSANPVILEPSPTQDAPKSVTLTFIAAVPTNETVTMEAFEDEASPMSLNTPVENISLGDVTDANYETFTHFKVFRGTATVEIPTAESFVNRGLNLELGARLKYGVRLKTESGQENIIGTVLVYAPGSEELQWQSPTVAITAPEANAAVSGKIDLKADVSAVVDEDVKMGWFVSSGKVMNRRSRSTLWKDPKAGRQTVIVTAHGRKTRGFAMSVIEVDVQ